MHVFSVILRKNKSVKRTKASRYRRIVSGRLFVSRIQESKKNRRELLSWIRKKGMLMKMNLDSIDEKIIKLLGENARTSIKDIASEVFLSSPAVTARIEKLQRQGIIEGFHVRLNPEALDYNIHAFVNVNLEPGKKKALLEYVQRVENIVSCYCVTGEYAMLMEVAFVNTEGLDHFINELQRYGKTNTQIVFSTLLEQRNVPVNSKI